MFQRMLKVTIAIRSKGDPRTHLDMRQALPVESQSQTLLHWIVNIEVLHTQNILVNIELAQIPDIRQISTLSMDTRGRIRWK